MRTQMKLMIQRKKLVRQDTPEADAQAEKILAVVEQSGGLTSEEILSLMVY
jgi:hypothetical protein